MGKALGKECGYHNVDILLGPAVNIKRNPLCGRNFEYLSEDPLLAGELAASYVLGVQEEGVGCSVKALCLQQQREISLRRRFHPRRKGSFEIYLRPFERIIRKAHPLSVMSAYNKINGVHCPRTDGSLEDVLRKDWGFDGLAMTDWGGIVDREGDPGRPGPGNAGHEQGKRQQDRRRRSFRTYSGGKGRCLPSAASSGRSKKPGTKRNTAKKS